jgi:hypothetical protein
MFLAHWACAAGSWLAGLMYDEFGFYAPPFAAGIGLNLLNVAVIVPLMLREKGFRR